MKSTIPIFGHYGGGGGGIKHVDLDPPPAHLVHEGSDLGVLKLDDLLLLAVHQSGQDQEEELSGSKDEVHGV
jgi:hypothetical protein